MKPLQKQLLVEIQSYETGEPAVEMFIDTSSIYWLTKEGQFVWMSAHSGIADYIDANHKLVSEITSEGIGNEGVYWMNDEFENPFHISDFITRIETINV